MTCSRELRLHLLRRGLCVPIHRCDEHNEEASRLGDVLFTVLPRVCLPDVCNNHIAQL